MQLQVRRLHGSTVTPAYSITTTDLALSFRSFEELITLLRSDRDQRKNARPFSTRLKDPPLEEQREKLETMAFYLSRAEKAEREGSKLCCLLDLVQAEYHFHLEINVEY